MNSRKLHREILLIESCYSMMWCSCQDRLDVMYNEALPASEFLRLFISNSALIAFLSLVVSETFLHFSSGIKTENFLQEQ